MNFRILANLSFLKKSIFELNCSLFCLKLTSLFLKIFENLTSQKSVPYKAFLIKHNVCTSIQMDKALPPDFSKSETDSDIITKLFLVICLQKL